MKRLLVIILAVLCPLLMGAAGAPLSPDRNFYVSDYSSLLSEQQRHDISLIAADLYEQTGTRLVYVSAPSLDGVTPGEYANRVITDWSLTSRDVLFLAYDDRGLHVMTGENADGVWEGMAQSVEPDRVLMPYRDLAARLYADHGVTPDAETEALLADLKDSAPDGENGKIGTGVIILVAVTGIALARGFRLNRKYKQQYLKGYVRVRRRYTRTYNEEDEYNNEKIYKITYDDQE